MPQLYQAPTGTQDILPEDPPLWEYLEREGRRHELRFADLPGYGYAQASKADRELWQTMIDTYLRERSYLRVVVVIIDGEVGPTDSDRTTIDYLLDVTSDTSKKKLLCVATKMDRVPKSKRKPKLLELSKSLELPLESVIV